MRKKPDPEKTTFIEGLAPLTNIKGIAKLLEHVRWYRELIIGYVKIALQITKLLRKESTFEWTARGVSTNI